MELILNTACARKNSAGAELKDSSVPSHNHDIFVLMRPTSTAAGAGCCIPTKSVTFKEPGKPAFQLELPLNSSLKSVKAALASATRSSTREESTDGSEHHHRCQQQQLPKKLTRTDDQHEGDARNCTLIVRGKKMSNSCLLGDYFLGMMRKSAEGTGTLRASGRTAPILVLWHPPRQDESSRAAAAAPAHHPRRLNWSPVAGFLAAASTPRLNGSQEERGQSSRWRPSRRSVQRRCKGAIRFSGMNTVNRVARRGLGIRPLS